MPLEITLSAPLLTISETPVDSIYAIIERVSYERRGLTPKTILFEVGYYMNAAASQSAAPLQLQLQAQFFHPASPEEANVVPIFAFLEQVLTAQLTALLPAGTTFANVA